jgi:hypothetical protein
MMGIETNMNEMIEGLNDFEKTQLPYAMILTANNIAFDAMKSARALISGKFGNKSLAKAVRVKKGTKQRPYAEVFIDDYVPWRENALVTLERGGDRERKGFERSLIRSGYLKRSEIVTPDDGIVKPWVYTQIMAQLKLNNVAGYTANESSASFKKKQKAISSSKQSRFMLVTSNKMAYSGKGGKIFRKKTGLAPGIYAKLAVDDLAPVRILKIATKPNYKKHWDLNNIVQTVYERRGKEHFNNAMNYAIKTAFAKRLEKSINKGLI